MSYSQIEEFLQKDSLLYDGEGLFQQNLSKLVQPAFQDYFQVNIEKKLICMDQQLIQYENNQGEWLQINFENALLEIIYKQKEPIGFHLEKGNEKLQVKGDCKQWIANLKKYSLQNNFSLIYKVLKKIGQGNQANIYKIKNKFNGNEYAAKIFEKRKVMLEEDEIDAINNEIRCHRLVKHDNLAELFEVYENKSHIILILDYFQGGEIQNILDTKGLLEEMCLQLIRPLFLAICHIHQKGIMHRDIKPQNIMLKYHNDFDSVCLIDFGLADLYKIDGGYLFNRCGTPGYVAPEVLRDQLYDYKVDVYSLGLILFLFLTGEEPFSSPDYNDMVKMNFNGTVPLHKLKGSENCIDFMQRILQFEPTKRLSSKDCLRHPFLVYGPGNQVNKPIRPSISINKARSSVFRVGTEISPLTKIQSPTIMIQKKKKISHSVVNQYQIRKIIASGMK